MSEELNGTVCSNEACQYSEIGQCVEGNPLSECPYLGTGEEPPGEPFDEIVGSGDSEKETEPALLMIARGDPLSVSGASEMLRAGGASVVALVGQAEAGKTSLIAEVYDAFQYGAYLSLSFRGSLTLIGFEKICHKVRGASRASDLSQERTDVATDPVFYHLALCADKDLPKNVLIADRSGERYREALDRPKLVLKCVELCRATVLNLLVDGARLCDMAERATVATECHHFMQAMVLSSLVHRGMRLNVVLTKLDQVDASTHKKDRAHADYERIVERIRMDAESHGVPVRSFKIAARPHNDLYRKGYGVERLLLDWMKTDYGAAPYVPATYSATRSIELVPTSLERT